MTIVMTVTMTFSDIDRCHALLFPPFSHPVTTLLLRILFYLHFFSFQTSSRTYYHNNH
ncbi:hypothetical protein BCR41DRAFT_361251, partial [Lobosporangium transversale]